MLSNWVLTNVCCFNFFTGLLRNSYEFIIIRSATLYFRIASAFGQLFMPLRILCDNMHVRCGIRLRHSPSKFPLNEFILRTIWRIYVMRSRNVLRFCIIRMICIMHKITTPFYDQMKCLIPLILLFHLHVHHPRIFYGKIKVSCLPLLNSFVLLLSSSEFHTLQYALKCMYVHFYLSYSFFYCMNPFIN